MAGLKPIPVVPARVILIAALLDTAFSGYMRDWLFLAISLLIVLVAIVMAERF